MTCRRCGYMNNPESQFCEYCGSPLGTSPSAPHPDHVQKAQYKLNVPALILGIVCAVLAAVVILQFLGVIHPMNTALSTQSVGSEASDAAVDDYLPTVCLLLTDDSAAWYVQQADDIAAAVEDVGFTLTVSDANRDAETQMIQLEDAIVGGTDVVVLEPVLAAACMPALQVAQEAGIAVVVLGSGDGLEGLYDNSIEPGPSVAVKLADWLRDYFLAN